MNVTKTEAKCSQLPVNISCKEGSLQTNSAEHEGYAGVHNSGRITENNVTDAELSMEKLLERIVERNNMNNAYKRVKSNKGSHGIDGMKVDELLHYLKEDGDQLRQSILDGIYCPNPVRRVEIPKADGTYKVSHITSDGIESAFNKAVKKANVTKNVSIHTLRHYVESQVMESVTRKCYY